MPQAYKRVAQDCRGKSRETTLAAQGKLNLLAASNSQSSSSFSSRSESGLFSGGGAGITLGSRSQTQTDDGNGTWHTGSTVGSLQGNVTLLSGTAYQQLGSVVVAPVGDITLTAPKIDIGAVYDTTWNRQTFQASQSGLTLSISNPVVDAAQTIRTVSQAAGQTRDPRMQALAAATAALTAKNTYDAMMKDPKQLGGLNVGLSLGSSHSESDSTRQSSLALGSNLAAGNNLTVQATAGDLTAIGSTLSAGNNANLGATGNINLLAAANTSSSQSNNSGSGASLGVGFNTVNGWYVSASANQSQGNSNGSDTTYTATQVSAGNTALLTSGQDTTLKGATVSAKQVIADVGGNLSIESLQDTSTYRSTSASSGFSVTAGPNTFSAGGSLSQTRANSDYVSANTQAGLKAGDNGFQVNVQGNTDLKGGVIASSDKAVQDNRNSLITGTLTTEDIQNKAGYEVSSLTLSASVGSKPSAAAGYREANGSASGTSKSAISGGAVSITDNTGQQALTGKSATETVVSLNRDTANANGAIAPIFDKKLVNEAQANAQIVAAFGQQAAKAVGDYAGAKLSEATTLRAQAAQAAQENDTAKQAALEQQAQAIEDNWKEGGTARVALHTLVGGLSGGIEGALGAGASALAAPEIGKAIEQLDAPEAVKQALGQAAGMALGAAVGGTVGASTGVNEEANNRQLHPDRKIQVALAVAQKTGQTVNPDDIKSRMLFDGEAAALENGTYNVLTVNSELTKAGVCNRPNECISLANQMAADVGSKGAVFVASPQDSPAVRYQTAISFLGSSFETWLNAPGNEANKAEFDNRIANTPSGLINLSDFYHVALAISSQTVAQEAGFASGATGIAVVGQALKNAFNYAAKGREAAILNNCTDCPQSMQDQPNLANLLLDIGLSATIAKDVAVAAVKGVGAVGRTLTSDAINGAGSDAKISNGFYRDGASPNWMNGDGSVRWPPNGGFVDTPKPTILGIGTRIDRYGGDTGSYFSPAGTPFEQRALPNSAKLENLTTYEIVKPLPVDSGKAAPWFDQAGMGTQYRAPMSVSDLINAGYLKVVR